MFGENGWCHSCGIPLVPQCGSLTLRSKGLKAGLDAWLPYWRYEAYCFSRVFAEELAADFPLDLRPVAWPRTPPLEAMQVVVPVVGDRWFDPSLLRAAAEARHGKAGTTCPDCGRWKWLPLTVELPPLEIRPGLGGAVIASSPECFGDGRNFYRHVLVKRELAERVAERAPREFRIGEEVVAAG